MKCNYNRKQNRTMYKDVNSPEYINRREEVMSYYESDNAYITLKGKPITRKTLSDENVKELRDLCYEAIYRNCSINNEQDKFVIYVSDYCVIIDYDYLNSFDEMVDSVCLYFSQNNVMIVEGRTHEQAKKWKKIYYGKGA